MSHVRPSVSSEQRSHAPAIGDGVRECVLSGLKLVSRQRAALDRAKPQLRIADDVLDEIELQFLWGYLDTAAGARVWPSITARDATVLCIIHFLITERGIERAAASGQAMALAALHDRADPLFSAVAARGRLAFTKGGDFHFVEIVKALLATDGQAP